MSDFGWCGDRVRLVPLDEERHFENCVRWMNDPEMTRWTLRGDFPVTALSQREFFRRYSQDSETDVVHAVETLDGEHVGVSGIHAIEWRHGTGMTGTLIGVRDRWGQGLGGDAIRTRSRYAFEVLGLRLLLSEVMAGNEASERALRRAGYVEVGRIPARWWKRGAHRDAIQLCLDEPGWRATLDG